MDFPDFSNARSSLLSKHLSRKKFLELKGLKTRSGFTLSQAIQSGIINPDSTIGIYAGDSHSYCVFKSVFDPIIADFHKGIPSSHLSDFNLPVLDDPDLNKDYILSTRIRVARNLEDFAFPPWISRDDRRKAETAIINALEAFEDPFRGTYFQMPQETDSSRNNPLFFKKGDRFQEAAGINREWPESRGIFVSDNKFLRVWVNEEDHLRIITQIPGGDLFNAFRLLADAINFLENRLQFASDPTLGFLTSCPSNVGTGMRASFHICLPKLEKRMPLLKEHAARLDLQIRGTQGEKTDVSNAVFDISNQLRLGVTEADCIQILYNGITRLIQLEKSL